MQYCDYIKSESARREREHQLVQKFNREVNKARVENTFIKRQMQVASDKLNFKHRWQIWLYIATIALCIVELLYIWLR